MGLGQDKLRPLGRSLASGLLAEDNATIDTEQMIIAAIADIEGPQLAMLELLVRWAPGRQAGGPSIEGPFDVPDYSHARSYDGWQVQMPYPDSSRGGGMRRASIPGMTCSRTIRSATGDQVSGSAQIRDGR